MPEAAAAGSGLVERLGRLDTPSVSDALDRLGLAGVVTGIGPMWTCGRVAGRVGTVRLGLAEPGAGPPSRHLGTAAIAAAEPGDVIVVDNEAAQGRAAGWGGLLGLAARLRGVAAVVVAGACRDVDDLAEVGMPIFARSATPRTARGRVVEVAQGEPLELSGVRVEPGDLVLADRSGVVFVPAARATEVIEVAEGLADWEARMAEALRGGAAVTEVLGRGYERMSRPAGAGEKEPRDE
ncbi:RraA family protein [Phytohabitans kaempferiae]|uniref:Putative 4-hydroxy-4-methyl-2-oxoglutarate aldolase n=1 Tax=Phytohabitans kaempferiae TaxID=1620943 RepID=A0ABV6LYY6_9ACTN